MSPRRIAAGRGRAVKAMIALAAVSTCLGAVAYAATRPAGHGTGIAGSKPVVHDPQRGGGQGGGKEEKLPKARFIEVPAPALSAGAVQFRFNVPPRAAENAPAPSRGPVEEAKPRRFQCRLDEGPWRLCESPSRLDGLELGEHSFAVRALARSDRPGPVISYSWRRLAEPAKSEEIAPQPFSIESTGSVEGLIPGDPARALPIAIRNPNPVPIEVTAIAVAIAAEAPSCPAGENFELIPSSASPSTPLTVPGGGTVSLPSPTVTAPAIAMRNLPVNQDSCRGVELELVFSGEARG
jgi:hypothetical protein